MKVKVPGDHEDMVVMVRRMRSDDEESEEEWDDEEVEEDLMILIMSDGPDYDDDDWCHHNEADYDDDGNDYLLKWTRMKITLDTNQIKSKHPTFSENDLKIRANFAYKSQILFRRSKHCMKIAPRVREGLAISAGLKRQN